MRKKGYLDTVAMASLMMVTLTLMVFSSVRSESLMGGHLDNQAITNPENAESTLRYRIANVVPFAFNGGQPFSLEKDPVTGLIDFNKAPPLKALNYTGSYEDNDETNDEQYDVNKQLTDNKESENDDENSNNDTDRDAIDLLSVLNDSTDDDQQIPNEINPYSPSFHDFLNLPVHYSNHEKYTSDKYPLISSSYANTKVQGGSNIYHVNSINHKNYHHGGKASTSHAYSMTRRPFVSKIVTTRKPPTTMKTTRMTTTTTKKPMTTTSAATTTTTTTTTSPSTTTTQKPTSTTSKTTTTMRTTITTTEKPITTSTTAKTTPKIEHYVNDYMDSLLPIEKMQSSGPGQDSMDQIFGISDVSEYDDEFENYAPLKYTPSTSPSTAMSTTTTTTTTTTTLAPSTPVTSMPLDPLPTNSDNNVGMINRLGQSVISTNVGFNDYSNHPGNLPSYSGLVVESASNVIVPPDQDTISFVLGNRQNVQGSYYAQGSAIPESPYGDINPIRAPETGSHNLDIMNSHHHLPLNDGVSPMNEDTGPKWWFNNNQSEKSQSIDNQSKDDKINVVAGYRVVFPTSGPESSTSYDDLASTISPTNPPHSSVIPPINDGLSELSEVLTPPAVDGNGARPSPMPGQRPPLHFPPHHLYHLSRPENPMRIHRPTQSNGYKMRPPHIDLTLPNILPQFRPNVKSSQRRGSDTIGTLIVPTPPKYPQRVSIRPPSSLPQPPSSQHRPPQRSQPHRPPVSHFQRLNPPPLPPPVHTLRLPTPSALMGNPDLRNPSENAPSPNEIPPLRRNVIGIEGQLDERKRSPVISNQISKSRLNDEDTDKIASDSLAMPPRAPLFSKRKNGNLSVATLQMIQQHRVQTELVNDDKIITGDSDENEEENDQVNRRVDESPVYVVYPVKGSMDIRPDSDDSLGKDSMDESVVIGVHGPQRPLPPETLSQQHNDKNFNEEDEKIIPVRPLIRRPSFPYPPVIANPSEYMSQLQEKPLLVPTEHHNTMSDDLFDENDSSIINQEDTNINVIPYLQDHQPFAMKPNTISTTLHLFSNPSLPSSSASSTASPVTPIAYVYTPTTRAPLIRPVDSLEKNPVLLPSQQPSSSSSSAPSPQNFMAPFVASISAEAPSKNGWSVVTGDPYISKPSESNDKIDRNDDNNDGNNLEIDNIERSKNATNSEKDNSKDKIDREESSSSSPSSSSSTSDGSADSFDVNNFKPQLFGGFRPIFEFPSNNDELPVSGSHKTDPMEMMEKPRFTKDSES